MKLNIAFLFFIISGCSIFHAGALQTHVKDCQNQITSMPAYTQLNNNHYMPWKDVFNDKQPSKLDLRDKSYATDDEVTKFIRVHNKVQECRKIVVEDLSDFKPELIPRFIDGFIKADNVFADLFEKKITWGEFAYQFKSVLSTLESDIQQDTLKNEFEKAKRLEEFTNRMNATAFNFALASLQVWSVAQTRMFSSPVYQSYQVQPTVTNCNVNAYGSSARVRCSSY